MADRNNSPHVGLEFQSDGSGLRVVVYLALGKPFPRVALSAFRLDWIDNTISLESLHQSSTAWYLQWRANPNFNHEALPIVVTGGEHSIAPLEEIFEQGYGEGFVSFLSEIVAQSLSDNHIDLSAIDTALARGNPKRFAKLEALIAEQLPDHADGSAGGRTLRRAVSKVSVTFFKGDDRIAWVCSWHEGNKQTSVPLVAGCSIQQKDGTPTFEQSTNEDALKKIRQSEPKRHIVYDIDVSDIGNNPSGPASQKACWHLSYWLLQLEDERRHPVYPLLSSLASAKLSNQYQTDLLKCLYQFLTERANGPHPFDIPYWLPEQPRGLFPQSVHIDGLDGWTHVPYTL